MPALFLAPGSGQGFVRARIEPMMIVSVSTDKFTCLEVSLIEERALRRTPQAERSTVLQFYIELTVARSLAASELSS
jgi:hypothetical protein